MSRKVNLEEIRKKLKTAYAKPQKPLPLPVAFADARSKEMKKHPAQRRMRV